MGNSYEHHFNKYWKDNMMDVRLKKLHLSEKQFQQIKVEIELAFVEGYKTISEQENE